MPQGPPPKAASNGLRSTESVTFITKEAFGRLVEKTCHSTLWKYLQNSIIYSCELGRLRAEEALRAAGTAAQGRHHRRSSTDRIGDLHHEGGLGTPVEKTWHSTLWKYLQISIT